jgi:hypothetical protein
MTTIHIAPSVGTLSEHYTADEQELNHALDYSITLTVDGREIEVEVTLYPDPKGGMSDCGTPLDGWCDATLVAFVRSLSPESRKALLGEIVECCSDGESSEIEIKDRVSRD